MDDHPNKLTIHCHSSREKNHKIKQHTFADWISSTVSVDRRAGTSQERKSSEPNCGYKVLHHHQQPALTNNLSSALIHKQFDRN